MLSRIEVKKINITCGLCNRGKVCVSNVTHKVTGKCFCVQQSRWHAVKGPHETRTHWNPVHLFSGPISQEPTPWSISDLWAKENVSSALWNQWVSADEGHRGKEQPHSIPLFCSSKQMALSGGFQQFWKFSFILVTFLWIVSFKPMLWAHAVSFKVQSSWTAGSLCCWLSASVSIA